MTWAWAVALVRRWLFTAFVYWTYPNEANTPKIRIVTTISMRVKPLAEVRVSWISHANVRFIALWEKAKVV